MSVWRYSNMKVSRSLYGSGVSYNEMLFNGKGAPWRPSHAIIHGKFKQVELIKKGDAEAASAGVHCPRCVV